MGRFMEISKNTIKAVYVPGAGDNYKLTITKKGQTPQISTGTVESYTGGVFTLKHSDGRTFTVTGTNDGLMTKIEGTIPIDGGGSAGTDVQAPGVVDVNLEGTTWKNEGMVRVPPNGDIVKVTRVATFFSDGTASYVVTSNGQVLGTATGTYSVKGTTLTIRTSDGYVLVLEVVGGNTIYVEGEGYYYKQ